MDKSPYTPNPAAIPRFLAHIKAVGKPDQVTQKYLKSVGFKSGNDTYLIGIFKTIGFLDGQGAPTEVWTSYRDTKRGGAVLAGAIKRGYSELFKIYPDAYRKDNEALRNFFTTHNAKLGESTLQFVVSTFKKLCESADFEQAIDEVPKGAPKATRAVVETAAIEVKTPRLTESSVNINIELHLPATEDATIYEKLFAALRKHLLS
ncbi:MAG: DUF5343 domain-containing protein [Candidatus Binatia bacterium]